jgi:hypothetical protein
MTLIRRHTSVSWERLENSLVKRTPPQHRPNSGRQRHSTKLLRPFGNLSSALRPGRRGNEIGSIDQATEEHSGFQYGTTLALALTDDFSRGETRLEQQADDFARRFPEDTLVEFNYLPTLRAQMAIDHHDPSKAIELLQAAAPYELGSTGGFPVLYLSLYPVYVRGEAYLLLHQGSQAVAEFQKILDHRGIVWNEPIGALAHLQLGRAYILAGDK